MTRIRYSLLGLLALLLALPTPSVAQNVVRLHALHDKDTFDGDGDEVLLETKGMYGTAVLDIAGAIGGGSTISFACLGNFDGSTWVARPINGPYPATTLDTDGAVTTTGQYSADISGCQKVRAVASSWGTGSPTVTLTATTASSGGASSSAGGSTTQYAEDAAHSSGDSTVFVGAIRRDTTPSSSSGTAGDYSALNVDANGRLYVNATFYTEAGAAVTPATDKAEDAAHTDADTGPVVLARRVDTAASSAGTSGDYATINLDALGLLWTRQLDPCSGVAKTYLPIDIVTATTTEITASLAGASAHYYICSVALVTAGANNVAIVDDDTDNCASVTSGVMGGVTAGEGFNLAANGGLTLGNGQGSIARTNGTNRVLCIVTSAAVQLSGTITVVAAP